MKEIQEGNILIARYLLLKEVEESGFFLLNKEFCLYEDLKLHDSWEYLGDALIRVTLVPIPFDKKNIEVGRAIRSEVTKSAKTFSKEIVFSTLIKYLKWLNNE